MMISEEMEQLVKLFDYALSSDNPAVKKALKNLLLLVSIIEPEEENKNPGPLGSLQTEIMKLRAEILKLHNDVAIIKERDSMTRTTPYIPTAPAYPGYPYGTWVVTSTSSPTYTGGSGSTTTSMISASGIKSASISDLSTDNLSDLIQEYKNNAKDIKTI